MFVFLQINLLLFLTTVDSLRLSAEPNTIHPGITKTLVLNCSLPSKDTYLMKILNSLILSRSVDGDRFEDVASIAMTNQSVNIYNKNGIGSGFFSKELEFFLTFQWTFPFYHTAGEYKCEANGVDDTWRPLTVTARVNVSVDQLTWSSVSEQLRDLHLENKRLKVSLEEHQRMRSSVNEIDETRTQMSCSTIEQCIDYDVLVNNVSDSMRKTKPLKMIHQYFHESLSFKQNRYYLSKRMDNYFNLQFAEETCQIYGGHLAEIDNEDEMQFVASFLRPSPIDCVFVTGSDETTEGSWLNPFTNKPLKYLKWGGGEPDKGKKENCICLWNVPGRLMADIDCSFIGSKSYLCEVPQ